ncbi:BgTH12-04730 [Blumeria graminis f. sp. triticale]|uniref:Bgt-51113 n=2 Tax=Blumeria graminis TaxID=34373 RepID=A0A9X9L7M4_BLUGR|nr:BgTH12-04730 [Blumeria graminis f. sp. triticale]VCU39213.1 Bgt-51113 [Blumeria graminis f. sp. tritici]
MKFLSAATNAALAGLLLLMPAVNGKFYYECKSGKNYAMSVIEVAARSATIELTHSIEPTVPQYTNCKSFKFYNYATDIGMKWYLVQDIMDPPSYRFYELHDTTWEPCVYRI